MRGERGPDFEDHKIRFWEAGSDEHASEADLTVMRLEVLTEELEESRTYRLRSRRMAMRGLERLSLATREHEAATIAIVALFSEFLHDATVKILAKRHKDNGDISYHIVATATESRHLIRPIRRVSEVEYRAKIAAFESEWVRNGPLQRGLVVSKEEWQRYQNLLPREDERPPEEEGSSAP